MKFIVALILTVLLAYAAYLYDSVIPWWGFAVGAFLTGLAVPQNAWSSWLSGFLGLLICWGGLAWFMDQLNKSLLSAKMAQVLPLGGSSMAIIAATAFVGALIGGFAALTGTFLRKSPVPAAG